MNFGMISLLNGLKEKFVDETPPVEDANPTNSASMASNALDTAQVGYSSRVRNATNGLFYRLVYGKWRNRQMSGSASNCDISKNSIIWLLGRSYTIEANDKDAYDEFLVDFRSRIWLSYRHGFSPLANSTEVSDCGWGCMLRCAQMMMAQAIVVQLLGRDWRLSTSSRCAELEPIIRLFEDCEDAPLGVHRLMRIAGNRNRHSDESTHNASLHQNLGKNVINSKTVGKWFSPSEAISLLRNALHSSSGEDYPISLSKLKVHLCVDMNVIVDEIVNLSENWHYSVFLVVAVRLGTKHVNKVYYNQLMSLFSVPQCCGVIGGRPKRAFYFVGCEGNRLYYLDPHTVQKYHSLSENRVLENNLSKCIESTEILAESASVSNHAKKTNEFELTNESVKPSKVENVSNKQQKCQNLTKTDRKWMSFHSIKTSSISVVEMEPSCAIGFLLRSRKELNACIKDLYMADVIEYKASTEAPGFGFYTPKSNAGRNPIFTVLENRDLLHSLNCEEILTSWSEQEGFEVI